MLTLFSTPKPFKGHIATIQRNAIQSWTLLRPCPEILLFGDEDGADNVATEFALRHVPEVTRNEFGTPLVNSMFARAQQIAKHDLLCYINCDIILMSDFMSAVQRVASWRSRFLMTSDRWDVDITERWSFERPDWEDQLRGVVSKCGRRRQTWYFDYFVFSRGLYRDIPSLAIGRCWWDGWLIWNARASHAPVVDVTPYVLAVHQNHDYSHHPDGVDGVFSGEEAKRNEELSGGGNHVYSIDGATHKLSSGGTVRWTPLRGRLLAVQNFLWKILVHWTFPLRKRLGMQRRAH